MPKVGPKRRLRAAPSPTVAPPAEPDVSRLEPRVEERDGYWVLKEKFRQGINPQEKVIQRVESSLSISLVLFYVTLHHALLGFNTLNPVIRCPMRMVPWVVDM